MSEREPIMIEQEPFSSLQQRTETIPEIRGALELAAGNPMLLDGISSRYRSLLQGMSEFDEEDLAAAAEIRAALEAHPDEFSASTSRLVDVHEALGDNYGQFMSALFEASTDDNSDTTQHGLADYIQRLEKGHQLKVQSHAIADGDEESDRAIWGHTLIQDPEAMLHFLLIHYLERVACAEMRAAGIELGNQKDFFLNGMIDAIIIDRHQNYDDLFTILATDREEGGVGWKLQRIEAITEQQ